MFLGIYLDRAVGLGEPWSRLEEEQVELLEQIEVALVGLETFHQLRDQYSDLLYEGEFEKADAFAEEHRLDAIALAAWGGNQYYFTEHNQTIDITQDVSATYLHPFAKES